MEVAIMDFLRNQDRPAPTRAISAALGAEPSVISEQLRHLEGAGCVLRIDLGRPHGSKGSWFAWKLA